jgi:hypothetical protein
MSGRCTEPGWQLAAMHDPAGRRGIWFRTARDPATGRVAVLEVCGGREGDDYYARFEVGANAARAEVDALEGILDTSRWVLDDAEDLRKREDA